MNLGKASVKVCYNLHRSLWKNFFSTVDYHMANVNKTPLLYISYVWTERTSQRKKDFDIASNFETMWDGVAILNKVYFMGKAWFHISGWVNSQNSWYGVIQNSHTLHRQPLHSLKVGVWCAVSCWCITDPFSFSKL